MVELLGLAEWIIRIVGDVGIAAVILALPFVFFRRTRTYAGMVFMYASFAIGAGYWLDCLHITYAAFGLWGTIIGVGAAGVGVVFATLGYFLMAGQWGSFLAFLIGGAIIVVIRILGVHLASATDEKAGNASHSAIGTFLKKRKYMRPAPRIYNETMKEEHKERGLFAAMVISKTEKHGMFPIIDVYLVNDSPAHYLSVRVLTGAFQSFGDELMETGKRVSDPIELNPYSVSKISGSDLGELDMVVWFDLDIADESGAFRQYRFSLPKYNHDQRKLPLLDEPGIAITLSQRSGGTIDDYVRKKGLKPKYFVEKDGEMVNIEEG